jgi:hypothetical protein
LLYTEFCKDKTDGLYKKKDGCQSYYNCAHAKTQVVKCPAGTLFNAEAKICDWKDNVDCNEEGDTSGMYGLLKAHYATETSIFSPSLEKATFKNEFRAYWMFITCSAEI